MTILSELRNQAKIANVKALDLMDKGIGRTTAYNFLRGVERNYAMSTLDAVKAVIEEKQGEQK